MSTENQNTPPVREGDPVIDHSQENAIPTPEVSITETAATTLEETNPNHTQQAAEGGTSTPPPAEGTENTTSTPPAPQEAGTKTPGEPSEFSPDFKYKVRDEEHEMDDWVKDTIKDPETFKKVQDLYTRGHGLEIAKSERDEFKQKYSDLEQSIGAVSGIVQKYYQDPTNPEHAQQVAEEFIQSLGLPKQMFLQYAIGELKYQQLPPEQKAAVDAQRQQAAQMAQLQNQVETSEQAAERMKVEYHTNLMNMAVADPSVKPVADQYDAQVGKPGAFKEFVIQRGIFHEQINGQIVMPNQLVQESIQMLGITPQGTATQTGNVGTQPIQTPQQPQTLTAQQMQAQGQKPTLPNISGQGTASPVKTTYSSIDQIRERYNQLAAQ